MARNQSNQKKMMQLLISEVKKILPGLSAIAKESEFEITISNDCDGFCLTCYTGAQLNPDSEAPTDPIEIETVEVSNEDIATIEDEFKECIRRALEASNGYRKEAAERLGISERTLYRKMKEYGL